MNIVNSPVSSLNSGTVHGVGPANGPASEISQKPAPQTLRGQRSNESLAALSARLGEMPIGVSQKLVDERDVQAQVNANAVHARANNNLDAVISGAKRSMEQMVEQTTKSTSIDL